MKKIKYFIPVIFLIFAVSCSHLSVKNEEQSLEKDIFAMDTEMTLKAYGKKAQDALSEAEEKIRLLDSMLDRGNASSEIYRINEQEGGAVSDDTAKIIKSALAVSDATDGAFDITIAPLMDMWGFYTKEYNVPSEEGVGETLSVVNYKNVSLNKNTVTLSGNSKIDLGGIAKGYLSSEIMDIFRGHGVKSGIVSLGGNVQTLGLRPDGEKWRVAIQNPDGGDFIGVLSSSDEAVITSGGYQRFFEQGGVIYHHILNPKTGFPARSGLKSVTVISGDAAAADGLSTAIFVMGYEKAADFWRSRGGFELALMTEDNKIYITEGIANRFTSDYETEIIKK